MGSRSHAAHLMEVTRSMREAAYLHALDCLACLLDVEDELSSIGEQQRGENKRTSRLLPGDAI